MGDYADANRKLAARFARNVSRNRRTKRVSPTAQLQSIIVAMSILACAKWGLRAPDVSRAFLESEPIWAGAYL